MSERVEYCKRLMKKALVIYDNLGPNESEEIGDYMEILDHEHEEKEFFLDDATPCKCELRSDVLAINEKKYCMDCLHYIQENE